MAARSRAGRLIGIRDSNVVEMTVTSQYCVDSPRYTGRTGSAKSLTELAMALHRNYETKLLNTVYFTND